MTSWRYTVNDVQTPAATPIPTRSALGSSHGLIQIYGRPGTQPVAAHKPEALLPPAQGQIRPSMGAPDVIYPALYHVNCLDTSPYKVVNRISTHEVPVPAKRAYVIPVPAARPAKMGGSYSMRWPAAPQNYTPGSGSV
jgi:hypothetical protein